MPRSASLCFRSDHTNDPEDHPLRSKHTLRLVAAGLQALGHKRHPKKDRSPLYPQSEHKCRTGESPLNLADGGAARSSGGGPGDVHEQFLSDYRKRQLGYHRQKERPRER